MGEFPQEFVTEVCEAGWFGIAMPEEYGGSGLGMTEASLMMQTITESGSRLYWSFFRTLESFWATPHRGFGTQEQKQRMLPPMIRGEDNACFGVTEPNAGLDTTSLEVRAEKSGDGYLIHGQKIWTSMAKRANKVLLLARTTPKEQVKKKTEGLSPFYTDLNKDYVEIREIEIQKMGRKAVDSNSVFYDGMPVPQEDLIGDEGKGFHYILHGLNPERILIAAEAVGIGRAALKRAVDYAKDRVVFDRPIGKNQGIAHPLAKNWMELEAANLMVFKAANLYDSGQECGAEANACKYLAAEARI